MSTHDTLLAPDLDVLGDGAGLFNVDDFTTLDALFSGLQESSQAPADTPESRQSSASPTAGAPAAPLPKAGTPGSSQGRQQDPGEQEVRPGLQLPRAAHSRKGSAAHAAAQVAAAAAETAAAGGSSSEPGRAPVAQRLGTTGVPAAAAVGTVPPAAEGAATLSDPVLKEFAPGNIPPFSFRSWLPEASHRKSPATAAAPPPTTPAPPAVSSSSSTSGSGSSSSSSSIASGTPSSAHSSASHPIQPHQGLASIDEQIDEQQQRRQQQQQQQRRQQGGEALMQSIAPPVRAAEVHQGDPIATSAGTLGGTPSPRVAGTAGVGTAGGTPYPRAAGTLGGAPSPRAADTAGAGGPASAISMQGGRAHGQRGPVADGRGTQPRRLLQQSSVATDVDADSGGLAVVRSTRQRRDQRPKTQQQQEFGVLRVPPELAQALGLAPKPGAAPGTAGTGTAAARYPGIVVDASLSLLTTDAGSVRQAAADGVAAPPASAVPSSGALPGLLSDGAATDLSALSEIDAAIAEVAGWPTPPGEATSAGQQGAASSAAAGPAGPPSAQLDRHNWAQHAAWLFPEVYDAAYHERFFEFMVDLWPAVGEAHDRVGLSPGGGGSGGPDGSGSGQGFGATADRSRKLLADAYGLVRACWASRDGMLADAAVLSYVDCLPDFDGLFSEAPAQLPPPMLKRAVVPFVKLLHPDDVKEYIVFVEEALPGFRPSREELEPKGRWARLVSKLRELHEVHPEVDLPLLGSLLEDGDVD